MSFFNFDYDPNNPRVGDRVIVVGDEQLNQTAEANERAVPWFTKHKGGEFYISRVSEDRSSVALSSPLTNSINGYAWNTEWLAPAPTRLPEGTCVMVPAVNMNERYRHSSNWCNDMDNYTNEPLEIRRPTANGYFEVEGNGYSWHRDWMFIMPMQQRITSTNEDFIVGDEVVFCRRKRRGIMVKERGIVRAVTGSELYFVGQRNGFGKSESVLLSRGGEDMFVSNSEQVRRVEELLGYRIS